MEPEGPPELVASKSCRNDRKLVAYIIEQQMRLIETIMPIIMFWCNVKNNDWALWFYKNHECNITPNSFQHSSPLNVAYLQRRHLERLNMLIAYSMTGSKLNVEGYLERAYIAYASEEDFYCLYNILHAAGLNTTLLTIENSVRQMYVKALIRGSGRVHPKPPTERLVKSCFSLAECKDSLSYGRHLTARCRLTNGRTALCEMPYASLLLNEFWMRCNHCLIYAPLVVIPCETCSLAVFCSVACRNIAREEYHSMECTIMPILLGQCTPIELLAVRLTIRVYKMFPGSSDALDAYIRGLSDDVRAHDYSVPEAKADYRKVYRLATNRRHLSKQTLTYDGLKAVSLVKLLAREHKLPTSFVELLAALTVRHLHILRTNALVLHCSVEDPSKDEYGSRSVPYALVLVTTGSMFNHSCNANVEYHRLPDGEIMFVTKRYIPQGSQMYINYRIDPSDTRNAFECYCRKCASERARVKQSSTIGLA